MKYFVNDLLQKGCTNYYKMCYSMGNVLEGRFLDTETLETDTQEREKRKDMKKKNAPIKVVAISSIAVLALAGISTVSVLSLAKSPDAAASGIQNADLDTASAKAAVREDVPAAPVVLDVAGAEQVAQVVEAPVYEAPVIYEVPTELLVVDSVVQEIQSPETVPVIATVQNVETVQETALAAVEEPVAELAVVNSEPVFGAPIEEPVYEEPVYEEPVYVEPVEVVPVEEPVVEEPVYEEPVYEEPVYEEPVAVEPVEVVEPVAEEPVYEDPANFDYEAYLTELGYDVSELNLDEFVPEVTETVSTGEDMSGTPAATTATGLRQQLVDFANSRVGVTPYVWAGRSLETGTDCSGFVNLVYNNFGMYASAGSDDYQNVDGSWGENISYNELQPGDVVVYRNGGHVGIYAGQDENGNDIVIHDSNEIDGVKVSDMNYSTPTAFVRVAGMDAADTSYTEESYTEDESNEDDWYYAGDETAYEDEYYGYEDEYYGYEESYEDEEDYGYWE